MPASLAIKLYLKDELKIKILSKFLFFNSFVNLKIPKNVKNGQILRLKGKGMKKLNSHRFGDQYIRVTINIPKKISKKTHKLLLELSQEIGEKVSFKRIDE